MLHAGQLTSQLLNLLTYQLPFESCLLQNSLLTHWKTEIPGCFPLILTLVSFPWGTFLTLSDSKTGDETQAEQLREQTSQ